MVLEAVTVKVLSAALRATSRKKKKGDEISLKGFTRYRYYGRSYFALPTNLILRKATQGRPSFFHGML